MSYNSSKRHINNVFDFNDSVKSYKIIEKYPESDSKKWAILVTQSDNLSDIWIETVAGSYKAKCPETGDLTMVWDSKEDAERYAEFSFKNAADLVEELPNWTCNECNEDNEGSFDSCWKCQTLKQ